ncbi:aldo/keto reductase [Planobispora longispora]|uniref:Oxidoreductase n=1 Tax=Planobispora longispora TaxID=28887 RepID=A0A8J3RRZ7_9ACTN|nr:aldo/keto reductase [Planobispora longispora]GIH79131.1 oxidoreductase [Planobispora longispora]
MTPEDAGTPDRLTIPGSVGASDGPVPAGGAASLGRSGVRVTALSFGGAAIGGLYTPVPAERAAATVRRALDRGVRYLDTAPHYGAGRAERRLGAVLAAEPPGSYVVSTKVGRRLVPSVPGEPPESDGFADPPPLRRIWDWSGDGVRRSLEESLERLGLDRIDVVYLHDPDEHEAEVYASAYPALAALRDEGVVGAIGVGMNQTAMPARFVRRLDLDVVLCAGRYTLLDRSAEQDLLPACLERGVSVVVGGVYNSGLLADPRPGARYDYAPVPEPLLARALRLGEVCAEYGVPLRAAALRFPLRHPAVASVLVGCRSPEEVDDNADLFGRPVPEALWDDPRLAAAAI